MVLSQKQKHRPMGQDRKPRDKLHPYGHLIFDKGGIYNGEYSKNYNARIYKGQKTPSSISRAGKTGQLHLKNEMRATPNTIHKSKLKMD